MELLHFGEAGVPVLVFPTGQGRFYEFEDHGMVQAAAEQVRKGTCQLVCVDSVDAESWFNTALPSRDRVKRHMAYENYLLGEVLPWLKKQNVGEKLWVAGCNFGGFHAVNFALRHPDCLDRCLSISGSFDVRHLIPDLRDVEGYYNNPMEYLPQLTDTWFLDRYRKNIEFILATGEWDFALDANVQLSRLLDTKGVRHWLDIWGDHARHDWLWWQKMFRKFLS
jgi:esterase/lipase superfamily enzyme